MQLSPVPPSPQLRALPLLLRLVREDLRVRLQAADLHQPGDGAELMSTSGLRNISGVIERRLLVNYALDPEVATALLPRGFRPHLVNGEAVAGVCLLRMGSNQPSGLPAFVGVRAENAAHRIAVEWDDAEGTHSGVYIPHRHSGSWLPVVAGDRAFPGVHSRADFDVTETDQHLQVSFCARRDPTRVSVDVDVVDTWGSSVFATLDDASTFFRRGCLGWSPRRGGQSLAGMRLDTDHWTVQAGHARRVSSSFFDSLPSGSARYDSILVMRGVPVTFVAIAPAAQTVGSS